jgi:hypothetical protein|tara:strand:+ start:2043 stop:2207 length:165 start_codon:yes stop_codon:yes gene_type:complete
MTFEDAVKRSIRAFRAGETPIHVSDATDEEIRYTPKFFDEIEEEMSLGGSEDGA